jgi:hypothetical protein
LQWVSGDLTAQHPARAITILSVLRSERKKNTPEIFISIGWVWPAVLIVVRIHISRNRNHLVPAAKSHTTCSFIIISTVEWMSPSVFFGALFLALRRRCAAQREKASNAKSANKRELKIVWWNAVFKGRGHGLLGDDAGKNAPFVSE